MNLRRGRQQDNHIGGNPRGIRKRAFFYRTTPVIELLDIIEDCVSSPRQYFPSLKPLVIFDRHRVPVSMPPLSSPSVSHLITRVLRVGSPNSLVPTFRCYILLEEVYVKYSGYDDEHKTDYILSLPRLCSFIHESDFSGVEPGPFNRIYPSPSF